ncbi:MraY family glycosyltransferase [Segetibacter koreensis]|uniref:MraY family glycosyltransferase n=1 Tax=Segetibacter koreensis TaxID=398037 RepID=UPI0003784E27|nr:MraY family glycosyltransferase [Segetibacter koreensis]
MERIIAGGLIAFLITFTVIPAIITVAKVKKLYDEPDDKRKLHKEPIPSLGGLGMFIGFIFSILLTVSFSSEAPEFQYYFAAFLIIFFLGMKDDIIIISPIKKFLGQIIAAGILIYKAKLVITNMHGLFGIYQINTAFSYILTAFSLVVIINAFNLIDGVDGLAGSLGLISSAVFGTFFLINGNIPYAVLSFTFAGSLVAFLIYNFHPAKIFMGDTGSLIIGLINSILVIKFIETGSTYSFYPVTASPAIGFGILLIPLLDTLRVFSIRIMNGNSPFKPDRNHIHHLLLNNGYNHKTVTFTCIIVTILITGLSFIFQKIGIGFLIAGQTLLFFSLVYFLKIKTSTYKFHVVKGEAKSPVPQEEKVRLLPVYDKAAVVEED